MAPKKLDSTSIMKALDWAYDQALSGIPGFGVESAAELARDFHTPGASLDEQARRLVRWQVAKASTAGFVTGLGGLLTMPVAIPANVGGVLFIQLRMIAALAHMAGYDIRSDQVRTLAYACMCGKAAGDVIKDVGMKIGMHVTEQAIKKISKDVILRINKAVGFRLVTRFGQKGLVRLGMMVPIAGGIVGAGFDASSTYVVGAVARRMFAMREELDVPPKNPKE